MPALVDAIGGADKSEERVEVEDGEWLLDLAEGGNSIESGRVKICIINIALDLTCKRQNKGYEQD